MRSLFIALALGFALMLGASACGDDDAGDATAQPGDGDNVITASPEGSATGDATPGDGDDVAPSNDGEVEDASDDLFDILSLVPVADIETDVPDDVRQAIDIQNASLTIEGSELVMTISLAGDVGEPGEFTRGYDFAFRSPAFVSAERGAYGEATLIIGAERSGSTWSVIKKAGANDPVALPTGTVSVEGSTVVIRVPVTEVIATEGYEWRAIAWHSISPEFNPADAAPDVPGFVRTVLDTTQGTPTEVTPTGTGEAVEPTATP
ncbi:MAG: hypothetical protein WEB00_11355 [Dehalococcoidia bacterium]